MSNCQSSGTGIFLDGPIYFASLIQPFLLAKSAGPAHQVLQQLLDQLLRGLVHEIAFRVEFLVRLRNHDLRLIYRMHVEKYKALPQGVLRPRSAQHSA
jgi:hypothetical protein